MLSILGMATTGGAAFSLVATAAKASKKTITYAAVGGATAGAGAGFYYQEEINRGITNLFASAPNERSQDQLDQMRAEQAEMEIRQKQAAIIAETAVTNATTQIEALVEQTSQQQACLEQSVQQFTETVSCAQHATQTLDSLTQPLHMAAIHAVKNVESLEEALSHTRDNMAMATTAFNTSNNTLSRLTKDISETHTQRLSTLTHLTTDTSTADIQLTRLANQQQAGDALATRHHNTIDHDELAVMNNKLRTLSQNFFSVVQDNRTLMSENSALKEALSRAMPTRQLSPEDTHPNHNDTDSPFTLN